MIFFAGNRNFELTSLATTLLNLYAELTECCNETKTQSVGEIAYLCPTGTALRGRPAPVVNPSTSTRKITGSVRQIHLWNPASCADPLSA